jgi:hypothetical protein
MTMEKVISAFFRAAHESDRSIFGLLIEALRLRGSIGRIGLSEYLDFRLYLNDLDYSSKAAFGGWRAQTILEEILVDDYSRFVSLDKVTMYALMHGLNLPIPELKAVYGSLRSAFLCIDSAENLAAYLIEPSHLPVYIKPSFGSFGRGNALVECVEEETLTLGDGSTVSVTKFCASLDTKRPLGWILQEPLVPHSSVLELCGNKISGLRIHSFLTPSGPEITRAIFKINVGTEDSDNFQNGATGNMAAAVDIQTGRVLRVISGTGFGQKLNPVHSKSGKQLVGFQIPYWAQTKSIVRDAHLAFPGYLCPGWDIAICNDGPKILEVNYFGDLDLPQHACREGFLDERFIGLMRDRGLDQLLIGNGRSSMKSRKNNRVGLRKHHWAW